MVECGFGEMEKKKINECYKRPEVVESHIRQRTEGMMHIEEKKILIFYDVYRSFCMCNFKAGNPTQTRVCFKLQLDFLLNDVLFRHF